METEEDVDVDPKSDYEPSSKVNGERVESARHQRRTSMGDGYGEEEMTDLQHGTTFYDGNNEDGEDESKCGIKERRQGPNRRYRIAC